MYIINKKRSQAATFRYATYYIMPSREFAINCNSKLSLSRKSVIQEIILLVIPFEYNLLIKRRL